MAVPVWTARSLARAIAVLSDYKGHRPDPDLDNALAVLRNMQKFHNVQRAVARVTEAGLASRKKG